MVELTLVDISILIDGSTILCCDNINRIMLARNPMYRAGTKHIEVHYHYIMENLISAKIDLAYVKTNDWVVDIFIALPRENFQDFKFDLTQHHLHSSKIIEEVSICIFIVPVHFSLFGSHWVLDSYDTCT